MNKQNIVPHAHKLAPAERGMLKGHKPGVLWFTGFSGSGKSTIANELEYLLNKRYAAHSYLLDGDNVRAHLNRDLGFSDRDRVENIRRIGEVCRLFADAGLIVLTAFISPFRAERDMVRSIMGETAFMEIHVDCPLDECERRDPKGLYQKARKGEILNFTGIDSPYEPPLRPELVVNTALHTPEECAGQVLEMLVARGLLPLRR